MLEQSHNGDSLKTKKQSRTQLVFTRSVFVAVKNEIPWVVAVHLQVDSSTLLPL